MRCSGNGGRYDYFVCPARHEEQRCKLPYLQAHRVEHIVARYYESQIKIDAQRLADLEPRLVAEFERVVGHRQREIVRCQKVVDDLLGQRMLLVDSHLANPKAVPLDVLAVKQADLDQQIKGAEETLTRAGGDLAEADKGLSSARQLLQLSAMAYRQVDPLTRRRWNQAFFTKLFVLPEEVKSAELTDEFSGLLREDLSARLEAMAAQPGLNFGPGSYESSLVELAGLEPATSWV